MYTQSVVGQISNCNSKAALCRPSRHVVDLHRSERAREYTEEHRNVRSEILSVVLLNRDFHYGLRSRHNIRLTAPERKRQPSLHTSEPAAPTEAASFAAPENVKVR